MRARLLLLLLFRISFAGSLAPAREVTVVVTEITLERIPDAPPTQPFRSIRKQRTFALETDTLASTPAAPVMGRPLLPLANYHISNRQLCRDGQAFASAEWLLYQCRIGDQDIIVIQTSRVSLNPLYLPIALTGHPIQLGDIWVLSFADPQSPKRSLLLRGSKAANWEAVITEKESH